MTVNPEQLDGPAGPARPAIRPALATTPPDPTDPGFPPMEQALARQVRAQREDDPLAGVKVGARLFYDKLIEILQDDPNGVRAELVLGVPAALAGFACQAATWESLVVNEGYAMESVFLVAGTADGAEYPFSDPMNKLLLEDTHSVWWLVASAARAVTDAPLPNVEEIVSHVVGTVGTPEFGQPRLPAGSSLGNNPPKELVDAAWPRFLPLLGLTCVMPEEWPILFGVALQRAMSAVQQLVDPVKACTIIMECAVPMAHLPMVRT
ncbi:MAG: hypothetical protein LBK95_15495 [Bifidobacteriaceae bacterium]|jgi:hypothetical protein|nr:hypothetical protein [Bifidobacteriaceae bacterium]